jgi:hypothetical protein
MCSDLSDGKSARIAASVMPEARYSRISVTVMRDPAMHGLPPRTPGVVVMYSLYGPALHCNDGRADGQGGLRPYIRPFIEAFQRLGP